MKESAFFKTCLITTFFLFLFPNPSLFSLPIKNLHKTTTTKLTKEQKKTKKVEKKIERKFDKLQKKLDTLKEKKEAGGKKGGSLLIIGLGFLIGGLVLLSTGINGNSETLEGACLQFFAGGLLAAAGIAMLIVGLVFSI